MKKLIIILLIIATTLNITACGNSENAQYTSEEYLPESDDQPNIASLRSFAEGNSGYYFLDALSYVQYYDLESGKSHILCDNPECTHEDEKCNAYAGGVTMRYADGNLYYVAEENTTGDFYFWKKSGDGTKTEKLFFLFHLEDGELEISSTGFCLHRGYVYYILDVGEDGTTSTLYRRKLEKNAKAEVIERSDSETKAYDRILGCGTKIYYSLIEYKEDESYLQINSYDILTGELQVEVSKIEKNANYCVYDNKIYYTDQKNIHARNMETGEDEIILSGEFSEDMYLLVDDKYLYFNNGRDISERLYQLDTIGDKLKEWYQENKVYVYDKESLEQVAILSIPTDTGSVFHVVTNYLILNINDEEYRILNKDKVKDENPEWVKIYSSLD